MLNIVSIAFFSLMLYASIFMCCFVSRQLYNTWIIVAHTCILQIHQRRNAARTTRESLSYRSTRRPTQGKRIHCSATKGMPADGRIAVQSKRNCQPSSLRAGKDTLLGMTLRILLSITFPVSSWDTDNNACCVQRKLEGPLSSFFCSLCMPILALDLTVLFKFSTTTYTFFLFSFQ